MPKLDATVCRRFGIFPVALSWFAFVVESTAASADTPQIVTFVHLPGPDKGQTQTVALSPGESFTVVVKNTCSNRFRLVAKLGSLVDPTSQATKAANDEVIKKAKQSAAIAQTNLTYATQAQQKAFQENAADAQVLPGAQLMAAPVPTLKGLLDQANAAVAAAEKAATDCIATDSPRLDLTYSDIRYSGYRVAIARIDGDTGGVPVKDSKDVLWPTEEVVNFDLSPWFTTFSGGVTGSQLTNPKYSLKPTTTTGTYTVQRNQSAEDSATLGLAAFVTVSNKNWTHHSVSPGLTLGVGTNSSSRLEYYPGISFQFGQLLVVTGKNIGAVDTLPAGLHEGDTTTNANALGSLPTRTSSGFFVALAYTFLGSQDKFTASIMPSGEAKPKAAPASPAAAAGNGAGP